MKVFCYSAIIGSLLLSGCGSDNSRKSTPNVVRISSEEDPTSLDPRLVTTIPSVNVAHMLYEGLMRHDVSGKLVPGLAEDVKVSNDGKTYTFQLRKATWSNGDPITAQDFVATWLSSLNQKTASPNAYQLYPIRGAKEFHLGQKDVSTVGLKAKNNRTLEVHLEHPTPYFLELTATHFYFPVHQKDIGVTNGPFQLQQWKKNNELTVAKNKRYWDVDDVTLDKIVVVVLQETPAYHLYQSGELDWVGSPLSTLPQDSIKTLKEQGKLKIKPAAGTHWFRFSTTQAPFNNANMRKAFALAINRQAIVDHVTQGNQFPALAIVPPILLEGEPHIKDHDTTEAWERYQEALTELKIDKDHVPNITLCYANNERNHKIAQAVQQQWNKTFGIQVKIQSCESKSFGDRVAKLDYQIASGSWFADVRDPANFLDVFKYKSNGNNRTGWEDPEYIRLLNLSMTVKDPDERLSLLRTAEGILLEDMPVAPLFHSSFNYLHKDNLYGVYVSELGYLDFKHAFYNGSPNDIELEMQ